MEAGAQEFTIRYLRGVLPSPLTPSRPLQARHVPYRCHIGWGCRGGIRLASGGGVGVHSLGQSPRSTVFGKMSPDKSFLSELSVKQDTEHAG